MQLISIILLFLVAIMAQLLLVYVNNPLPSLPWSKLSDVLFASGFTALNLLNLVNLITFKMR